MGSYIPFKITRITVESPDTKSFTLQQLEGPPITYIPGQFLTLIFPKTHGEERRSYSISSTPILNEPIAITVKRIDNGEFSRHLFDTCKVGDQLLSIGASGLFTLPIDDTTSQLFFLAAGSGITPILSLIKTALIKYPGRRIDLIYSNRSQEVTIFASQIAALQQQYPLNFNVVYLHSNARNLLKARLSKLILSEYVEALVTDRLKTHFFLCGPDDYMQMASITLLSEGIPHNNIRREIFNTHKPKVKELPPDQDPHQVTIQYEGKEYQLKVQYPTTILRAAQQHGINLPYSCEAGKCGTCAATCTKGNIWMSYNEVLLDKELSKGRILTCVAHPYATDAVLDFPSNS